LLDALIETIASAGARGVNDTGARRTADTLRDARIALDIALTAAGRALADREDPVRSGAGRSSMPGYSLAAEPTRGCARPLSSSRDGSRPSTAV
jgi:hypothetical protein